jgi:hypothetical protein
VVEVLAQLLASDEDMLGMLLTERAKARAQGQHAPT